MNAQDIFGTFPSAIKTANTAAIAKNFEKRVDITIDENSDNYSSEQAEMILKNFLLVILQLYIKVPHQMAHNM